MPQKDRAARKLSAIQTVLSASTPFADILTSAICGHGPIVVNGKQNRAFKFDRAHVGMSPMIGLLALAASMSSLPPSWTLEDVCSILEMQTTSPAATAGDLNMPDDDDQSRRVPGEITESARKSGNWGWIKIEFKRGRIKTSVGKCEKSKSLHRDTADLSISPDGGEAWLTFGGMSVGPHPSGFFQSCMFSKRDNRWIARGCFDSGAILT